MSKLREISKKKESIKATITGLALVLAIGSAGGVGSYAYFTAKANINNSLNVTMGTMDISIGNGIDEEKATPGTQVQSEVFNISNKGSLDQYIKTGININNDETNFTSEELKSIKYELFIIRNGVEIQLFEKYFSTDEELEFIKESGNKVRINSKQNLEFRSKVTIPSTISQGDKAKNLKFNLNVEGSQINAE